MTSTAFSRLNDAQKFDECVNRAQQLLQDLSEPMLPEMRSERLDEACVLSNLAIALATRLNVPDRPEGPYGPYGRGLA